MANTGGQITAQYDQQGNQILSNLSSVGEGTLSDKQLAAGAQGAVANKGNILYAEDGTIINPVSVSGQLRFGQTVTAVLAPGWSCTGFQWLRNGVAISGATSVNYTIVGADIGNSVVPRASGLSYSALNGEAVTYEGPPLLRFATAFNKIASSSLGVAVGAERRTAGRIHRPIGSADKKFIQISSNNFFLSGIDGLTDNPTGLTVVDCLYEANNISIPVSWGGDFNPTFEPGAEDVLSDPLYPEQFGLATFNRNRNGFLRYEVSVPVGGNIPLAEAVESLSTCRSYYVGAGSVSNVRGTGPLVFSGATSATFEISFLVVGEDVDTAADARAWVGIGDSIVAQGGPSSYFHQACAGNGTNYISGCSIAKSGAVSNMFVANAATLTKFLKYANGVVEEFGTNQVGSTLPTIQNNLQAVWALLWPNQSTHPQSRELVVLRAPLLNRTTDGTGATVHSAAWNAGGIVEQLNDWFLTQVGVTNRITAVASGLMDTPNLMRRGAGTKGIADSDFYKWLNGAVDAQGLHPLILTASGVNGLGANMRVPMLAYA